METYLTYDKMWVLTKDNNYETIKSVGEIELAESGGMNQVFEDKVKHKNHDMKVPIKLLTISSPVGDKSNAVLIDKDKVVILGGIQEGDSFAASNKVKLIDIKNTNDVNIKSLKSMNFSRQNSNTTILPTGELFVNGGAISQSDLSHSVLTPEIYNFNTNRWTKLENNILEETIIQRLSFFLMDQF